MGALNLTINMSLITQSMSNNDRTLQIMRILMDEYISEGQPVSSRALANNPELSLSPASIRVILAELEQRGYLTSPHTSAGRVPTTQGYRLFIDSLLSVKPIQKQTLSDLQQSLTQPMNQADLLKRGSDLLAKLTQFVGIGGDGSLIQAAHTAVEQDLPVLGVNRGRLGFLTDIHPDEVTAKVQDILAGQYDIEQRFFMMVTTSGETPAYRSIALNDTVILPGLSPHMIEYAVYIDNQFVCQERADGVIVATPTGSTAYCLSGGGPILHPQLDALVLVPMFPHTLSSRPLVVHGNSEVSIEVVADNRFSPQLSCDGQERVPVIPGGRVNMKKYAKLLKLVHPKGYNYYQALRSKLGWGGRH